MRNFSSTFPNWTNYSLDTAINEKLNKRTMDKAGYDLLQKMFVYDPARRISAKAAVKHPYFDDLDKTKLPSYNFIQSY